MRRAGRYFYEPVIEAQDGAYVWVGGRRLLMLGSYSYLGLIRHPRIAEDVQQAIRQYGCGTHGTRITAGSTQLHRELETSVAAWLNVDDAMAIGSGFAVNTTAIQCLASAGDVVFYDHLNHASLHDGCRASRAALREFSHQDLDALDRALGSRPEALKFVVVDAVFSMEGTVVDLPKLLEVTERHGAVLMVDEAHSFGVLGRGGRGITEHFGVPAARIPILMGVFSKALPGVGGFIAGSHELIAALKATNHGFIFSGSLPPAVIQSSISALKVLRDEPERVGLLQANVERYVSALNRAGLTHDRSERTPIVPIRCPTADVAFEMTRLCLEAGVFVVPAVFPVVPVNAPRIRTTVTAALSAAEIEFAVDVLVRSARSTGLN